MNRLHALVHALECTAIVLAVIAPVRSTMHKVAAWFALGVLCLVIAMGAGAELWNLK
jgi:hypothetical protein